MALTSPPPSSQGDLGYIGCSADVLDVAHRRCSGRRACDIHVPNTELEDTRPCYQELKTYFEASFRCLKGMGGRGEVGWGGVGRGWVGRGRVGRGRVGRSRVRWGRVGQGGVGWGGVGWGGVELSGVWWGGGRGGGWDRVE